ncbi:carboxylesterase/lipase family protein [Henriciella litoralis]|uniref:carboxylesterase/lipase family protein n=1 Tax=Henriciella litoralis TaxID=568102 RepID=UPI0009FFAB6A|nr:carboxylesterase family protein [Henriciella litoralis]
MKSIFTPSRRFFLMSAASIAGAGALAGPAWARRALFPVVETAQGKLQGASSGGISSFKGVPYGAPTGGANRFMPPQPVEPWGGVREAIAFSDVSPQMPGNRVSDYADLIAFDRQPAGQGEDCLSLNLWTPSLDKEAKKPVIVVLHGGGFYAGSGNSFGMDGERMARFADSVVIAVNHRLGAFGFAHLASFDEDFAQSGAVGMMDIVAALEWVRENVAQFGGDPSRVLVYGQSGGGAKTSNLLAMPSAKGLFHAAGVMSGSMLESATPEAATEISENLMRELGVAPGEVRKLQETPFKKVLAAQAKLEAADRAKGEYPRSFGPVVDGTAIPRHPFAPDAPAVSADVPMIISTALDERTYRMIDFDLDEAGLLAYAEKHAGDQAEAAVALYRAEDADATPYLLKARMDTDLSFRKSAFAQAERKAAQAKAGGAPVWTYLWTWPSPAYGGRYGAVHGIDVGLSLNSVRGGLTGTDEASLLMADRISSAWAAFAATGDPNNAQLPEWSPYTSETRATMIFDNETRVENDPRADIRAFWESV